MMFNLRSLLVLIPLSVTVAACAAEPGDETDPASDTTEDALTNAETAKRYSCASNALWTIAGVADALICGTAAVPSGGLTVACYVIGAGAAGAGALAYCGAECAGAHAICPGYDGGLPASFRETSRSRLVSRCVGSVRYSHWEGSAGRRPEFENGTCICRQSCATP